MEMEAYVIVRTDDYIPPEDSMRFTFVKVFLDRTLADADCERLNLLKYGKSSSYQVLVSKLEMS